MVQKLPSFLFIGPDKSGSTWLYDLLRAHPEVFVPEVKDLYFFDRQYARGIDWYAEFFAPALSNVKAIGEISHDYLFSPLAAVRIKHDLPEVKLIASLRNPIERAESHCLFLQRSGFSRQNLEDTLRAFPETVDNGLYAKHLASYLAHFGRDRLLLLDFSELEASPRAYARRVFRFLELDDFDDFEYEKKSLPASKPRSYVAARLAKNCANALRALRLERTLGAIKSNRTVKRLMYREYGAGDRPHFAAATREALARTYRDDIVQLREAIGFDVSRWEDFR